MKIIKLSAIDSTNTFLKFMVKSTSVEDFTVVVTEAQLKGKGQMGENWSSEIGKNLTFSIYKTFPYLHIDYKFYLNYAVSLAIFNELNKMGIPNLSIKWPNDIMSASKKLCGILIENTFSQKHIKHAVIGIGINVNQTHFSSDLQKATSVKNETGLHIILDELLSKIIASVKSYLDLLEKKNFTMIKETYHNHLYKKDKVSTFRNSENFVFSGIIKEVTDEGKLQILTENDELKEFEIKEIKLL